MPLNKNIRYNTANGLPVTGTALLPQNPERGSMAIFGSKACFVETIRKTGAGLPTGENAEQYIVHFGPGVYRVSAYANGASIAEGSQLNSIITRKGASFATAEAVPGVLTNATTNSGSGANQITILGVDEAFPRVLSVVDGTSIAAGSVGIVDVVLV